MEIRMVTAIEIAWAAGFIEGEGHLHLTRTSPQVECSQVQKEPLERLVTIFGGTLRFVQRKNPKPNHKDYYRWQINGPKAAGVMMTIYAMMSPVRKEQIEHALNVWKAAPRRKWFNATKTHCKRGHEFTPENTYLKSTKAGPKTYRQCRTCQKDLAKRWYEASKE